jgi:hypothetical protein
VVRRPSRGKFGYRGWLSLEGEGREVEREENRLCADFGRAVHGQEEFSSISRAELTRPKISLSQRILARWTKCWEP